MTAARPILVPPSSIDPKRRDVAEDVWILVLTAVKGAMLVVVTPIHLAAYVIVLISSGVHRVTQAIYQAVQEFSPRRPGIFKW